MQALYGTVVFFLFIFLFAPVKAHPEGGKNKVNGVSLWSDITPRENADYEFVAASNANWVSLQPYGVIDSLSSEVKFDIENIWECSSFKGLEKSIQIAHERGYCVMLKPHLFLNFKQADLWVGNLNWDTEQEWRTFEDSYFNFIMSLSKIADSMQVEMLSIGTELATFAQQRKHTWSTMIDSVRSNYTGAITYCANFDAYEDFPLWDAVDLIGIDAYFTIDTSRKTSITNCREGWKPIKKDLKKLSQKYGKKILFTEFGYTSSDYCAFKPFGGHGNSDVNLVAQANAYRAIFYTFWDEPWFSGGFSWFWRFDNDQPENYNNTSFSPQNKPAANIISKVYLEHR